MLRPASTRKGSLSRKANMANYLPQAGEADLLPKAGEADLAPMAGEA